MSKGQTFTQEFRDEALRLIVTSGKPVTQIARELGISANTLYGWQQHARYGHVVPVAEHETPDQEAARLRKELELVKQERDILKKAIAYFAQPPTK